MEEDRDYCVYLHRRLDNNEIVYVGEGRKVRANSLSNSDSRNKAYQQIRDEVGVYVEIYADNLLKQDAELIEKVLIKTYRALGYPITNVRDDSPRARRYLAEDFEDRLYIDPTSPSGLRWKRDIYNLGDRGAKVASKGDIAGCLSKKTGYWVTGNRFTHRIVYALHYGECPEGLTIDHLDRNKSNNSIENLELVTRGENSRRASLGREGLKGELNSGSKVTEEEVLKMYQMFLAGKSNKEVGDAFGLHDRYVSLVRHGKRWGWLREEMGITFPESRTQKVVSNKMVEDVCILLELGLSNKEISEIVGMEVSSVSRLRHNKTLGVAKERALKVLNISVVK